MPYQHILLMINANFQSSSIIPSKVTGVESDEHGQGFYEKKRGLFEKHLITLQYSTKKCFRKKLLITQFPFRFMKPNFGMM